MTNKVDLCAKAAFVCAISPNLVAAAVTLFRGPSGSCFDFWPYTSIICLFMGFSFYPNLAMLLGTISVVLAMIAIRKRETKSRLLAVAALVIGILEVMVPVLWYAKRVYYYL